MKRYIVTFSDTVEQVEDVTQILSSTGITENVTIDKPVESATDRDESSEFSFLADLGIAVCHLSEEQVVVLRDQPEVLGVEEDVAVSVLGRPVAYTQAAPAQFNGVMWNMHMVRANQVWASGRFGEGVKVAVLDTGIASHVNLQTLGGASFVNGESSFRDLNGHGTHCAGIIAGKGRENVFGVAFGVDLYAVKVLSKTGSGYQSDVIRGMNWSVANNMQVISMSLGGRYAPNINYINAVKRCQGAGVTVVCAAGNSFNSSFPWVNAPANSYAAGDVTAAPISVASVDSLRNIASSSSRGTNGPNWNGITASAPGVNIYSTYLNHGYQVLSGTSMACPHVAGLAALIIEGNPGVSPRIVKAFITSTADQLGSPPLPNVPFGYGLIDCASATGTVRSASLEEEEVA